MLGLNGLPRFSSPLFSNPKFDRVTDDRFFLWIDSQDKYFNSEKVQSLLASTGALSVEEVREDDSPSEVPADYLRHHCWDFGHLDSRCDRAQHAHAKSGESRLHVFFDMDFQPSRHTQSPTAMFADGRVQRPPVPGTVARGELGATGSVYLGLRPFQVRKHRFQPGGCQAG
ncbi:MAG: quinol:electron acceptor oxidoreductase subunit ActD [Pirellulaceae bacterium]